MGKIEREGYTMTIEEIYKTIKKRRDWLNGLDTTEEDEKSKRARISELDELMWLIEDSI